MRHPNPLLFIACLLFLSSSASAETTVYYFGGHRASQANVDQWKAQAQAKAGGSYKFVAFPWLGAPAKFSKQSALQGGASTISRVANEILAKPEGSYVIVGHSSGQAVANAVAEKLVEKRSPVLSRVRLLALDGFSPSAQLQRSPIKVRCFYARGPNGLLSPNGKTTVKNCGGLARKSTISGCSTQMCLHFRLMNLRAPSDLGRDYGARGFRNLDANVQWLNEN